jgi:hypothetical protein
LQGDVAEGIVLLQADDDGFFQWYFICLNVRHQLLGDLQNSQHALAVGIFFIKAADFVDQAVDLILKGASLLCAVHCPEFGGEIQVQFVATHVVLQGADIERPVNFHGKHV